MTVIACESGSSDPVFDSTATRRRLELRSLVAALATNFLATTPEQVDSAICEALEAIGRFAGADHALLSVFDESDIGWRISHEWCREGLRPFNDSIARVPAMPWTLSELSANRPIRIRTGESRDAEPPEREREMVAALGLRSAFVIPVFARGELVGAAGIGAVSDPAIEWSEDMTALLELPGRIMLDALARRTSERARRVNEALWASFCACEVVGVFILDRDGRVLESNDTGLRAIGRSRAELTAGTITWKNVTPREYRPLDLRALERLDRGGVVFPWEKELQRPDGTRVPVLATLVTLAPFCGELLALCIDLSERERAQKELRRSNRFDRLLTSLSRRLISLPARSIDAAISEALGEVGKFFDMDRAGLFETTDDCDVEILRLGWVADPSEVLPQSIRRIPLSTLPWWRERLRAGRAIYVPTLDDLPPEAAAERAVLESGGVSGFVAIPLSFGRVSRGAIHFAAFHPLDLSDQHLALLRVFCDIVANARERERTEAEIRSSGESLERRVRQRRAQLEASNAELEAFAYSVSHDLRAPLRTIAGLSDALLEDFGGELDDDARALVRRMTQAAERMSDLIATLLQLSCVVRTEVAWDHVDLSAMIADLAAKWCAADPGRRVVFEIAPGIVARGHQELLRIAFSQLLDNAWKFTARRALAHIFFGVEERAGRRVYFVRDDGVGFDPALAEKLFGAFQRLHGVAEFEGHGIGLATVERVVRMHRGRVWAEGSPDRGATIYLALGGDSEGEPK